MRNTKAIDRVRDAIAALDDDCLELEKSAITALPKAKRERYVRNKKVMKELTRAVEEYKAGMDNAKYGPPKRGSMKGKKKTKKKARKSSFVTPKPVKAGSLKGFNAEGAYKRYIHLMGNQKYATTALAKVLKAGGCRCSETTIYRAIPRLRKQYK